MNNKLEKLKTLAAFDKEACLWATTNDTFVPDFLEGARYQHAQDQALINFLLIELGRTMEALEKANRTIKYPLVNGLLEHDIDVRRLNKGSDAAYCALEEANRAIDEMIRGK